mgnify:FL=1
MKKNFHRMDSERIHRGGLSTALLLAMIVALVGLNVGVTALEKQNGWRMDFSFNGVTTQSEATKQVLAALDKPVHIYALFQKGGEDLPLMELLNRYAAVCDRVTWEQMDPSMNPGLLSRFTSENDAPTLDSLIVFCQETDRYRILNPEDFVSLSLDTDSGTFSYAGYTYERALTYAIEYVTRDSIPRAVIIQGHGELDESALAAFTALLEANHWEVSWQNSAQADWTPDPEDLLIFFSPMRDISEVELKKIVAFANAGGSLMFTCDYSDPIGNMPNYASLLRAYGFVAKEGIVVASREEPDSYYNNIRIDLIPEMLSTDITMALLAAGSNTLLAPGCRAFETPEETDRNLIVMPLLQSGETAYLKVVDATMTHMEKEEGEETGPFTLALQARRITTEGYVSKAFIAGSSTMLTDEQIYTMTDSKKLVIAVVDFLLDTASAGLDIPARDAMRPALSARSNRLGSLIVTALPMSVLLLSLVVLLPRRKK